MVNVKNHKISIIYFHKFIYSLFDSIVTLLLVISILISMIKKRKWENCTNSFSNKNKKIKLKVSFAIWIHINFYMPIWYLKVILFISYVFTFINKFLPECFFLHNLGFIFNHFLFTRHAQWPVVIEATNLSCTKKQSRVNQDIEQKSWFLQTHLWSNMTTQCLSVGIQIRKHQGYVLIKIRQ